MPTISPPATPRHRRLPQPAVVMQCVISLRGRQVTFLEAGVATGGPVVVLLHGQDGSSQTWAAVAPLLGMHAHVIAPDLPGHGLSPTPRGGLDSLDAHAAVVRDLLVAAGLQRATIVGHCFGGEVAIQFAHRFPERTHRLALVGDGRRGHRFCVASWVATLPGIALALRIAATLTPAWLVRRIQQLGCATPSVSGADIDGTGHLQRLARTPVLLVAEHPDPVIPLAHVLASSAAWRSLTASARSPTSSNRSASPTCCTTS